MHIFCDLGSSNIRVAASGSDDIICEPSVIAKNRHQVVAVGTAAYEMIGRNPNVIDIQSPVANGVIKNIDAAAEIIKYSVSRFVQGRFVKRYSITLAIPSGLTGVESRALEETARLAGANHVRFVNSCVAGAAGAGLPVRGPNGCLVVNLGGGITEVALLSMNGVVASHLLKRGGQSINEAIIDRIRKDHHFLIGQRTAENIKRCGFGDSTIFDFEVRGRDLQTGLPGNLRIPHDVVIDPMTSYTDAIVNHISMVIAECPPELAGDIMESGIVLIGGGANISRLAEQLEQRVAAPVVIPEHAESAVIRGLMNDKGMPKARVRFNWSWMTQTTRTTSRGDHGEIG